LKEIKMKKNWIKAFFTVMSAVAVTAVFAGCTVPDSVTDVEGDQVTVESGFVRSSKPRLLALSPDSARLPELISGNTRFAFDLYHKLFAAGENFVYSPHSLSISLAMTYAGARGTTEEQMKQSLNFTLPQNQLHPAFNTLDQVLYSRMDKDGAVRLQVTNALWGQQGYPFLESFLDTLAENYDAGMQVVNFSRPEEARRLINQWAGKQTKDRIQELVPPGVINGATALILANATTFDGKWLHPFAANATYDDAFTLLDGSQVTVPMMTQAANLGYAEQAGVQFVELPYKGDDLSMVILLPDEGTFEDYAQSSNPAKLDTIPGDLKLTAVRLTMPKFQFDAEFRLKEVLMDMGMTEAFGDADFSGIDGTRELFISEVCHGAFIAVDEAGTEAAAASAVIMGRKGEMMPEKEIKVDRPFLFLIRDIKTGAILFLGHVVNPAG
jgi:serpin B